MARPGTDSSRPASGVPPWEITDSFLAVPPAPAETTPAGLEPQPPGPPSGSPGAGGGDSTDSFPAVDSSAEQEPFPPAHPGDSNESFPALRRRADADAFRLFPPVRDTGSHPPAPPATDGED